MRIELVAGGVLLASPADRFFGTAQLLGVGERLWALTENDDERFHGGSWRLGD